MRLEQNVVVLKDQLLKKQGENLDLKECFEKCKEVCQENMNEKDKMLSCLEKEISGVKADAEISGEENELGSSRTKLAHEKTISDMKKQVTRYQEIICLMKDSLAGLAAMHEDTSDKLIEAVKNTAIASQVVVGDVKTQFQRFEKEMGWETIYI